MQIVRADVAQLHGNPHRQKALKLRFAVAPENTAALQLGIDQKEHAKIAARSEVGFRDTYNEEVIKKWLTTFCRRFFQQQFKRSCLPDGPKVGSVSLSPRGDWRMPSDASAAMWLKECEEL